MNTEQAKETLDEIRAIADLMAEADEHAIEVKVSIYNIDEDGAPVRGKVTFTGTMGLDTVGQWILCASESTDEMDDAGTRMPATATTRASRVTALATSALKKECSIELKVPNHPASVFRSSYQSRSEELSITFVIQDTSPYAHCVYWHVRASFGFNGDLSSIRFDPSLAKHSHLQQRLRSQLIANNMALATQIVYGTKRCRKRERTPEQETE